MRVKTIQRFTDLQEKKIREVNEEFEVSKKRFEVLQQLKVVEEVKVKKSK